MEEPDRSEAGWVHPPLTRVGQDPFRLDLPLLDDRFHLRLYSINRDRPEVRGRLTAAVVFDQAGPESLAAHIHFYLIVG